MRKLRLNVEELQVESFSPSGDGVRRRGTVNGQRMVATYACTEGWDGCPMPSVGYTCDVQCSDTHIGFTCGFYSCAGFTPCTESPTETCIM
jgi:hypothetical protein